MATRSISTRTNGARLPPGIPGRRRDRASEGVPGSRQIGRPVLSLRTDDARANPDVPGQRRFVRQGNPVPSARTAGARSHAAIAAERQEGRCPNPAAPTTPAAPVCPARKSSTSARRRHRAPALRLCDHVVRQGAGGMPGVPPPRRAAALEHSRSGRLGRNRPGHLSGLRAHGRRTGNADRVPARSNRRRVPASTMFDGNERRAVAIRRPYMWHVPAPGAHRARMSQ